MLVSCNGDVAPPKTPPPPETPPTPDEMVEEALRSLQILNVIPPDVPLQLLLAPEGRDQLLAYVRQWKTQADATEGGTPAVKELTTDLEARMKQARQDQNAALMLVLCDLVEELGSKKGIIGRYREWARIHNNRPVVKLKGWFEFEEEGAEQVYAFCEVYLPDTEEVRRVVVEEGEEFLGLQFLEIIGKRRGMRLRYLATKDTFEVHGP